MTRDRFVDLTTISFKKFFSENFKDMEGLSIDFLCREVKDLTGIPVSPVDLILKTVRKKTLGKIYDYLEEKYPESLI